MHSLLSIRLDQLRDQLRLRGQRQSVVLSGAASTGADLAEALEIVEEWGAFVEAMYLMMAADRRVKNVEREVLRGALNVLSGDAVRTRHMEAMIDAATRRSGEEGQEKRLDAVIESLKRDEDPLRAEFAVVVAAAIAAADDRLAPEESRVLSRLIEGLGIPDEKGKEIVLRLEQAVAGKTPPLSRRRG